MIIYKKLNIIVGLLLVLTSITRFLQILFDPIANTIMYYVIDDFAGDRIFSLIGGVILGYAFYLFIAFLIGFIYTVLYFLFGFSILILRKSRTMIKSIIIISCVNLILEMRAVIILSKVNYICFLMMFHLIIDLSVLIISIIALFRMQKTKKIQNLKNDPYIEPSLVKN